MTETSTDQRAPDHKPAPLDDGSPPKLEPEPLAASLKTLLKVAVFIVLLAALLIYIGRRLTAEQGPREAWQACQDHARAQLERPETADFAGFDEARVAFQAGHYSVSAAGTAQGATGEQIDASYACAVEHGRPGQYKILSFSFTKSPP